MTEKGFTFHITEFNEVVITKENNGREFFIGDVNCVDTDTINELVDLLNKQEKEEEYWKKKAMTLLLQIRRLLPRMTDEEIKKYEKELDNE